MADESAAYAGEIQPNYDRVSKPDHVPADRVVDFNHFEIDGVGDNDVYAAWDKLHGGPDIVWTPNNGGHWIVTRAADVKWVQENYQIFSHEVFSIPRGTSRFRLPPLTVDPPLHARYRAVLNPAFTPSRVREMSDTARDLTVSLIDGLKPKGGCEFVSEFARVMPVSVFLGIVNLPLERREEFVQWAIETIPAGDQGVVDRASAKVSAYLASVLDERAARPGEDLLSRIAGWRNNPRYQGEWETLGMAMLVFAGGLDTVANMLAFTARHLAMHPEHRRRIIEEPAIVPRAAEEYIRRYGLSNTGRLIIQDTEYKGLQFKTDEMIMVPIAMSSMDDREYENPLKVDFDRNVAAHNTFGNGPHKCVGAPLARAELAVFLEEWLKHIPDFRIDPDRPVRTRSGPMNNVVSLHLQWDR